MIYLNDKLKSFNKITVFRFLGTVPSAPTMIGITVASTFHNFFCSLARFGYLTSFSPSFNFTLWVCWNNKIPLNRFIFLLFFFLFILLRIFLF